VPENNLWMERPRVIMTTGRLRQGALTWGRMAEACNRSSNQMTKAQNDSPLTVFTSNMPIKVFSLPFSWTGIREYPLLIL